MSHQDFKHLYRSNRPEKSGHPTRLQMVATGMSFTAIALIVGALMFAGGMDYADEVAERDNYCNMVASGAWPDFRGIYEEECK